MSRLTPGFIIVATISCVAFAPSSAFGQTEVSKELRTWVDNTGSFKIRAEFIEIRIDEKTNVEKVYLRRSDVNKVVAVPLSRLCEADLVFLGRGKKEEPKSETPPETPPETTQTPNEGGQPEMNDLKPKPLVPAQPPADPPTTNTPTITKPPADGDNAIPNPQGSNEAASQTKKVPPAVIPFKRPRKTQPEKRVEIPIFDPDNKSQDSNPTTATNPNSSTMPEDQPATRPTRTNQPETPAATQPEMQPDTPVETLPPAQPATQPEAISESTPPVVARPYSEGPQPDPIDASLITVRPDTTARPWLSMSDEQLVNEVQLTGTLAWAGKTSVSHNLEPQAPNFNFVISLRAAELLDMVGHIGQVKIDSFIDDLETSYSPVLLPPRIPNPTSGWVVPRRGTGGRFAANGIRPVFVDVEFPRPKIIPKAIEKIAGTFQVSLVEQSSVVSVQNVSANTGTASHQALADKGLSIIISSPDPETIVAEVAGDISQVMEVNLTGIGAGMFGENRMNISGKDFYQFNFVGSTPPDLGIDIVLIEKTRTITVPFNFDKIQFSANMR